MATPTNLSLWLNDQAWPIGFLLLFIGLTYVALRYSARRRAESLAREREGVTEVTFAEYLSQFGFDATITASTYRYLQEVQLVNFPILPSDKLDEDLGLGHEDIEQTVTELTAALGRRQNPGLVQTQVITVEDLVRLLQAQPRAVVSEYQQRSVA